MKNKTHLMLILAMLGWALESVSGMALAARQHQTLLIIPDRPRVVQLALDAARLRPLLIVTYHGQAKTAEPILHLRAGTDWQYISLPNFIDKTFVKTNIQKAIIIGDDQIVPAELLSSMPWCANIERLPTLNVADLINGLDQPLKFNKREWQWLANQYGLTLLDLNAERRNTNPYATPRSKLPLAKREFKQEQGEAAPALLIIEGEESSPALPATLQPETQPLEKPPK